ncbi:MAG: hypothetical protein L6Q35_13725 [Phycisphaerales bacterium]|nr:hypothetical protein [Phycisphaerales bacterium]
MSDDAEPVLLLATQRSTIDAWPTRSPMQLALPLPLELAVQRATME